MRNETKNDIECTYPDEVTFAYNPNYIIIERATECSTATIQLSNPSVTGTDKTISVSLYNGYAKVYISNLFQTIIQSYSMEYSFPSYYRNTPIIGSVIVGDTTFGMIFYCIAGSFEIGQRLGQIGSYFYDNAENVFVRRIRWFQKFPFSVSVLFQKNTTVQTRYDRTGYSATTLSETAHTLKEYDPATIFPNAQQMAVLKCTPETSESVTTPFDDTYDYTFKELGKYVTMIRLTIDNSEEGHYLRWVDNLGQIQYWLFSQGVDSVKTADEGSQEIDVTYGGMYFRTKQVYNKSKTKEIKCAAIGLTIDEIEYVQSIAASVDCQMYLPSGAWVPVNVKAGTFEINEKLDLQDFEITIELPTQQTQIR